MFAENRQCDWQKLGQPPIKLIHYRKMASRWPGYAGMARRFAHGLLKTHTYLIVRVQNLLNQAYRRRVVLQQAAIDAS